jgi:hypothetical protein
MRAGEDRKGNTMAHFAALIVAALLTIPAPAPSYGKAPTAGSQMSGTDLVFGSTGKCHAGKCPVKKKPMHQAAHQRK